MIKIKKSAIGMIVLAFTSLIFITGSPFQICLKAFQTCYNKLLKKGVNK